MFAPPNHVYVYLFKKDLVKKWVGSTVAAALSHLTKVITIAVDDAPVIKDPTSKQFEALSRADWSKSI